MFRQPGIDLKELELGTDPQPTEKGDDLAAVDEKRRQISATLDPVVRKTLGQFLTPQSVATFMAAMFEFRGPTLQLLDAGAGIGSLTAAVVARCCNDPANTVTSIKVDVFEIDPAMAVELKQTLQQCDKWCKGSGIKFSSRLIQADFIEYACMAISEHGLARMDVLERYDAAILNPPYAKVNSNSKTRGFLRALGVETSNLYSGFVAIAISMLRPDGQLVAITPRSFCNGPYFRPFRKRLLQEMTLKKIHVYESRKHAFSEDSVLQENVILLTEKARSSGDPILITSSNGPDDPELTVRLVSPETVVATEDTESFIHVPTTDAAGEIARRTRSLPCSLADLNLAVSTGRVVDFRARDLLRVNPEKGTVPLIYAAHFDQGFVRWPKLGGKKPNAIVNGSDAEQLMVPNGCYVLTKRFSSKEERRRLVAAVYDPTLLSDPPAQVGFENHLNYFHEMGRPMSQRLAWGLTIFLNSTLIDEYFRQFSGHTQVNATDLRSLRFPSREQLVQLADLLEKGLPSQEKIDEAINSIAK